MHVLLHAAAAARRRARQQRERHPRAQSATVEAEDDLRSNNNKRIFWQQRPPGRPAEMASNGTSCDAACAVPGSALEMCVVGCATPVILTYVDFIEPIVFICLSALASGLTLGLMSLDTVGLQIIIAGGVEPDRSRAEKILPIRKRGNQLLCTLLLSNTLVNARLSIFLGGITSGVVGGLVATALIVIFGEIIPQATCSRHALLIGSACVEPMRLVMVLLSPICWPMARMLDYVLGDELTSGHTKREIEHLLRTQDPTDALERAAEFGEQPRDAWYRTRGITLTEKKLLGGVLALSEKTAQDVMTDFDNIFMIDYAAHLDFEVLREIYRSGYTRVPVYDKSRLNLVGVLNTKDLVLVDADDELPVRRAAGGRRAGGRRAGGRAGPFPRPRAPALLRPAFPPARARSLALSRALARARARARALARRCRRSWERAAVRSSQSRTTRRSTRCSTLSN